MEGLSCTICMLRYDTGRPGDLQSALMGAVRRGHTQCVMVLVDLGADLLSNSRLGTTAMHSVDLSKYEGDTPMLSLLMSNGCTVDMRDSVGDTALHAAVSEATSKKHLLDEDWYTIINLLHLGADVNAENLLGKTPIQLGLWTTSHHNILQVLLDAGADPNTRINNQETLIERCIRLKNTSNVNTLLYAGARVPMEQLYTAEQRMIWRWMRMKTKSLMLLCRNRLRITLLQNNPNLIWATDQCHNWPSTFVKIVIVGTDQHELHEDELYSRLDI